MSKAATLLSIQQKIAQRLDELASHLTPEKADDPPPAEEEPPREDPTHLRDETPHARPGDLPHGPQPPSTQAASTPTRAAAASQADPQTSSETPPQPHDDPPPKTDSPLPSRLRLPAQDGPPPPTPEEAAERPESCRHAEQRSEARAMAVSLGGLLEGDLQPSSVLGGLLAQVLQTVAPEVMEEPEPEPPASEAPQAREEGNDAPSLLGGAGPRVSDNVVASSLETVLNRAYRQEDARKTAAAKLMLLVLKAHGAYTYEHCMRLVDLGLSLAKELGYEDDQLYQEIEYGVTYKDVGEVEYFMTRQSPRYKQALAAYLSGLNLAQGAMLHDFGKIKVPAEILYKPGLLTPDEVRLMQQHPVWGADILRAIPSLHHAIPATLHHHERWDGRGYPHGLAATDIPLPARIVAVVDSFDAMVADRPYRKSLTLEQARAEISRGAGTQFDPQIAATFAAIVGRVWQQD